MQKKGMSKIYYFSGLIAAIVLLIFFNYFGWLNAPKKVFYKISVPVLEPFKHVGGKAADYARVIGSLKSLIKEIESLRKENEELVLRTSKFEDIKKENELLRQQLQIVPPLKSRLADADIIGYDPANQDGYFLINRGKKDGAVLGQAVIYGGGYLVGKIIETEYNFSKVLALTGQDSTVYVITQETRIGGVIRGDHGVGAILDTVPPEKEIKIGEALSSSGLDSGIPKGMVIGRIEEKISGESEVFQKFKVRLFVNYKEIEKVFVVLGSE